MKKLRIGILTHNYPSKSSESKDAGKFVYSFAHELAKRTNVFIYCPDFGEHKERYKSVPVTWFDWGGKGEKFGTWSFFSPLSVWKFVKLVFAGCRGVTTFVRKNKLDYLLCFWNFPSGAFALYARKRLGIKYSTWALGSDIYIYSKLPVIRQITQLVLENADNVFVNSHDIARELVKLEKRKTEFLPTASLVAIKNYKKTVLDKKRFNFLYLGRLEKIKGPDVLIEAAKILSEKDLEFTINFIGMGSMHQALKNKIKEHHLAGRVRMLGYIEDERIIAGYLRESDCLVIPSRSESFPLVVTEALQVGLPMIGANVGDMPDIIKKNGLGYIFAKENVKLLVKAMQKMIEQGKKIKRLKASSMTKLSAQFSLVSIVNKFLLKL